MKRAFRFRSVWRLLVTMGTFASAVNLAWAQAPYYQGKTIVILRGGEPGGTGDVQARAVIPYMKKYIPGNPTIIVENMAGAAGRKAANYIYTSAKPDGLTIGAVGAGLVVGPILGLPGTQYDLAKLIYLGSTESGDPYVFVSRKESGLDSIEKLRTTPGIKLGAQAIGHPIYVATRMFALLIGIKDPKFVVGYGGPELDIALARGEIDARANGADSVLQRNREALDKGEVLLLAGLSIPKGKTHPRFAKLPELDTFAKTEQERQVIDLFRTFLYPRWPYILPPGTPPEIVKILRGAMAKAFADTEFRQEFKKMMTNEATPLTGEEVEKAIRELPRNPEVVALYKKLAEHGPLPPR
jgi:tripartite-type tricarboxylate transporter receptor subunit TctC